MAAVAIERPPARNRRAYQRRVAGLLEQIEERRRELNRRLAWGVRPAGLRDLKADLQAARAELASTIEAGLATD